MATQHTPRLWDHQHPQHSLTASRTPASPTADARTPSPNYFGLQLSANTDVFSSNEAHHARANWSPPTSNVRSTAAASPHVIPLDQNPEFEAFRKQSEGGRTFSLGNLSNFNMSLPNPPRSLAKSTHDPTEIPPSGALAGPLSPRHKNTCNPTSNGAMLAPEKPRSPKRMLSSADSTVFANRARRHSPASYSDRASMRTSEPPALFAEASQVRPSLPATAAGKVSSFSAHHRAETLPINYDAERQGEHGPVMITPQHFVNLVESSDEEILLLDLRVSTQYAMSRIRGALNLCIPTTLLKRPSFNVEKLADTFGVEEQKRKFQNWRSSKYIVVYDANSAQLKDATTCVNTLSKFAKEGWTGASYIIRGGFAEFASKFSSLVVSGAQRAPRPNSSSLRLGDPQEVAPVIGGCPMPATQNAANPFFGNIRQNMDLIGGVGQMPLKRPVAMTKSLNSDLPKWLREAADENDEGKTVSERFLAIEKREQKRMQEALSGKVVYGSPAPDAPQSFKIAGIEKGSKNRYNNIWPFEHTRVKIQGVPSGECDYMNANHIRPSMSNKKYIATQGPIPVTFADFWNVVWQQDVRVIVMLTAEKEGGQVKAHNYWSDRQYGPLQLSFLSEHRASLEPSRIHRHRSSRASMGLNRKPSNRSSSSDNGFFQQSDSPSSNSPTSATSDQPYVTVRKFTLSNSDFPFVRMREITQLQYSNWPDFGAPAHPAHLLGLVEQCDAVVRANQGSNIDEPEPENSRPVLVHCSAGCGRTGTFCTVDSVIDILKRQRSMRRSQRQASPMDLDRSPTSNNASGSNNGNPFFGNGGDGLASSGNNLGDDDAMMVNRDDVDLVEKTVEDFRHQRLSMVQSLRQFVLCYESVMEWLVEQHSKSS
ncbi:tyrosine-protein phosphatase non-receptor type 6 [Saccharata proteae CBS 121410]|uniref:protein-tyrosine-phosphatase n=1 Tax=Saccharata proteae CBS 121410 TaxID=1314787 RepID=A0A9P4HTL2_9PEZI|nr:tyrosine-protein phosphatase non-receptor type 6 [Saccharata proteae CBS 121410]